MRVRPPPTALSALILILTLILTTAYCLLSLFIATIILMFSALDTQMTFFLSAVLPHFPIFDSIFRTLSFEGATTIMWLAVVIIVFIWEFYVLNNKFVFLAQLTKLAITLAVTIVIAGGSVHYLWKPIFQRVRPYVQYQISAPYCPKDFSFPSGHATVAFAGAYILSKFDHDRRRRVLYALLALGVSYSRIYLLCHYVGDVFVGALYGLIVATTTYRVIHKLYIIFSNQRHKAFKLRP